MKLGKLLERISVDPEIQHGQPCIKNSRTPVFVILESLATGMDMETLKEEEEIDSVSMRRLLNCVGQNFHSSSFLSVALRSSVSPC